MLVKAGIICGEYKNDEAETILSFETFTLENIKENKYISIEPQVGFVNFTDIIFNKEYSATLSSTYFNNDLPYHAQNLLITTNDKINNNTNAANIFYTNTLAKLIANANEFPVRYNLSDLIKYINNNIGNMPLTFYKNSNEDMAIAIGKSGSPTYSGLQYRTDILSAWTKYNIDTIIPLTGDVNYIQFKNTNAKLSTSAKNYVRFALTGDLSAHGNISSMLSVDTVYNHCFYGLLSGCSGLRTAPYLTYPTITGYNYANMFIDNTNLRLINTYFTDWNISGTADWVSGVNDTGIFVYNNDITMETSTSGIPPGWITASNKQDMLSNINFKTFLLNLKVLLNSDGYKIQLEYPTYDQNVIKLDGETNNRYIWEKTDDVNLIDDFMNLPENFFYELFESVYSDAELSKDTITPATKYPIINQNDFTIIITKQ